VTHESFNQRFERFTTVVEHAVGSPWAFFLAVLVVIIWAMFGPHFGWSDTHQLLINTGTTILTFWLVFLIQATQTKNTVALHLKLDELIRVTREARNELINIEDKPAIEIAEHKAELNQLKE
jgi:low affinity Fe/Cu permease